MPTARAVGGKVVSGRLQGLPVPASFFLPPWERGVCGKCRTESLGVDDGSWKGGTQHEQRDRGEASASLAGAHCVLSAEAWDLKQPSLCPQVTL